MRFCLLAQTNPSPLIECTQPMPDVPPPAFISACKAVLLNFGNIETDADNLQDKVKKLGSEAEVVATRIYGKGKSARDQQDEMFNEKSTSIFDLENMELDAMSKGEKAPWSGSDEEDDMIKGMFDSEGKMRVGGG